MCGAATRCPSLTDPANGTVVYMSGSDDGAGAVHGAEATFRCDAGFSLSAPSGVFCRDSTWIGDTSPKCKRNLFLS